MNYGKRFEVHQPNVRGFEGTREQLLAEVAQLGIVPIIQPKNMKESVAAPQKTVTASRKALPK